MNAAAYINVAYVFSERWLLVLLLIDGDNCSISLSSPDLLAERHSIHYIFERAFVYILYIWERLMIHYTLPIIKLYIIFCARERLNIILHTISYTLNLEGLNIHCAWYIWEGLEIQNTLYSVWERGLICFTHLYETIHIMLNTLSPDLMWERGLIAPIVPPLQPRFLSASWNVHSVFCSQPSSTLMNMKRDI